VRKAAKVQRGGYSFPAEHIRPRPGDFPVGSLESRAAARALHAFYAEEQRNTEAALLECLPPVAKSVIDDCNNPAVRIWMLRLLRVAVEREKVYGMKLPWPTPEEHRHTRAVNREIDRMTDGQAFSLQMNNPAEWRRLKAIAEENLRTKAKKR
jgi:hypothetical protein